MHDCARGAVRRRGPYHATFEEVTPCTCTERYRVRLISPSIARSHPDNNVQHLRAIVLLRETTFPNCDCCRVPAESTVACVRFSRSDVSHPLRFLDPLRLLAVVGIEQLLA